MRDLRAYFEDAIRLLHGPGRATSINGAGIVERDNQYGSLNLSFTYPDGSTLHVHLWADCSGDHPHWVSYGFEYKSVGGERIFRYDDARDWPRLPTFPHHLHLGPGDNVLAFGPPTVRQLASIVSWHLDHPGEGWTPA